MEILEPILQVFSQILRQELEKIINGASEDKLMNKEELSEYLGVSKSWIDVRIKKIPHYNEPFRFRKSEIDKWLEKNKAEIEEEKYVTHIAVSKGKNKFRVS